MSFRALIVCMLLPCLAFAQEVSDSVVRDIEYSAPDGHSLKLDLYLPGGDSKLMPVIVFIHGGGWRNGSKKSAQKNASWLNDHGFAVVAIDYRLTDVAGWPAQIDDCYESVRWVRRNAEKFHLDPNNIGCMGTSAGAHLAILLGTRPYPKEESVSSRVKAVCDWFGPSELMTMPPNNVGQGRTAEDVANSNGAKLLRATVREVPELAKDASGIDHVTSDDHAFLIMHGDKDPGVPLAQSTRLHRRLVHAGVPSTLHVVAGAGHGGKAFHQPDAHQKVRRFFEQQLKNVWHQGAGPQASYASLDSGGPSEWSVIRDENIAWKKTLPETGQSTVTVWEDRLFFTTMQEVNEDAALGQNIVAWCCDANSGETMWTRDVKADHPLRLSGCFSDSSAPPAVTDGNRVVFFNASGKIACFDFEGKVLWQQEMMPVGRSQPFLCDNAVVFTHQRYMPDGNGHFTHEHKNAPLEMWTNLTAMSLDTGDVMWSSECGVNMGCVPMKHQLADGREVIFVGRGGGHSPPEKPPGVSMINAEDGSTIWTLPLDGFMSTMTFNLAGDDLVLFHRDEHLWVSTESGKIGRRVSITNGIPTRVHSGDSWSTEEVSLGKQSKPRSIIQSSNLLVGKYHYFRSYTKPYLGRVNVVSGAVEQLQLPVDIRRTQGSTVDELLWDSAGMDSEIVAKLLATGKKRAKELPINQWAFMPNDMKNARGFEVMGDARSRGTGWGHHASQSPTANREHLYIPIMNGTVYVIDWDASTLDERAIRAINDLGDDGRSFNRASVSLAGARVFAHTIGELICIAKDD